MNKSAYEEGQSRRPRLFFTEIFSLVQLLSQAIGFGLQMLALGFLIIVCSEIYLLFADQPRPGWLGGVESVYGVIWRGVTSVARNAFTNGGRQVASLCAIEFVQFKESGEESGRWTFVVKDLNDLSQQATSQGTIWQKVGTKSGANQGATGWVNKADWDAKRAKSECE
jgi:hypothetical protein